MDLLTHIRRLLDYEDWATARILDCLGCMEHPPQLALEQLCHTVAARLAWLARIHQGHSDDIDIWVLLPLDKLINLHLETIAALKALASGMEEQQLAESFSYRSYEGTEHSSTIGDMLVHLVNHSSHHRGIILRSIREAGGDAPPCDWIVFTRE